MDVMIPEGHVAWDRKERIGGEMKETCMFVMNAKSSKVGDPMTSMIRLSWSR